jgi:cell division protein FtsN
MKMKMNYLKVLIIFSLISVFGCSSDKNEQTKEIRFVDLQGNARAIKTRVPEANAKIMSGQISSSSENNNQYLIDKKNVSVAPNYYDKNIINQKNSVSPKFSDADVVKNYSTINSSKEESNKINYTDTQDSSDGASPVVEYDLAKDDEKNSKNTSSSKKVFEKDSDSELEDNNSSSSTKSQSQNYEEEILSEDTEVVESSTKNGKILNKNLSNKNKKIFTYSNKKIKQNNRKIIRNTSPSQSLETQDQSSEESSQKIYYKKSGGGGRIYVQVGSFFNSRGAKERLNLVREFGKGKVLVAYNRQNKRIYRSVFGPFKSKNSAINFRDKIIESGNEAIIIRGN